MKNKKVTPTTVERGMRAEDFIVSKTDPKGRITYGNRIFIEFSGYDEKELLGAQHNIIRHPDMPRGVFQFLWNTIQDRRECFAYVKNMSKDGSFYWVFAHVTPSLDAHGKIIGYLSVRRKPKPQALAVVVDLYQEMLAAERRVPAHDACQTSMNVLLKVLAERDISYEEFIVTI